MNIAIIGTAGRKEDGPRISRAFYEQALAVVRSKITLLAGETKTVTLVSGGAAVADHMAVSLFLEQDASPESSRALKHELRLHAPANFDPGKGQYTDTGKMDYRTNPGGTANYYHWMFSQKCGWNSLSQIAQALKRGAEIVVTPGFKERNTRVAQDADVLIALTFGQGPRVKEGGTADTVRKFLAKSKGQGYHLDLNSMQWYPQVEA